MPNEQCCESKPERSSLVNVEVLAEESGSTAKRVPEAAILERRVGAERLNPFGYIVTNTKAAILVD